MHLDERTVGDVIVLAPAGRMTRDENFGVLPHRVRDLVKEGRRKMVLDLARVSYMDSTCLGEIVSGFVTVRKNGGLMRFASPTPPGRAPHGDCRAYDGLQDVPLRAGRRGESRRVTARELGAGVGYAAIPQGPRYTACAQAGTLRAVPGIFRESFSSRSKSSTVRIGATTCLASGGRLSRAPCGSCSRGTTSVPMSEARVRR